MQINTDGISAPFVGGQRPEIASVGYADVSIGENEETCMEVRIGYKEAFKESYVPPRMTFSFDDLMGMVDGVKEENVAKTSRYMTSVFSEEFEFSGGDTMRDELSRAESNAEYCFLNDVDLESLAEKEEKDLVLINPSVGTVSRCLRHNIRNFSIELTKEVDKDYAKRIKYCVMDGGLKVSDHVYPYKYTKNKKKFYYGSFNKEIMDRYGCKGICWAPNPVSFSTRGHVIEMNDKGTSYEISYRRSGFKKSFVYKKHYVRGFLYTVDYLHKLYSTSRYFKQGLPFLYDLYSDVQLYNMKARVVRASLAPYDCRFLVGDYYHDKHGIFTSDGEIVHSFTCNKPKLSRHWKRLSNNSAKLKEASYMISCFTSFPVWLGRKERVHLLGRTEYRKYSRCSCGRSVRDREILRNVDGEFFCKGLDGCSIYTTYGSDIYVEVESGPPSYCYDQSVTRMIYSNATYQTVYGYKYMTIDNLDSWVSGIT